jgi:LysM repeat protein
MYRKVFRIIVFSLFASLFACKVYRPVVSTSSDEVVAGYIDKYKDLAVSEMKRTGIPASITIAQGMIESDYGRSRLALEANNHFGIKCHDDWTGPSIRHDDDRRKECFRKYRRPEDSFYDHSDFLTSGSRYDFLFDLDPTDYKGWARGLKKAGYATNPGYADMLIRNIEANELFHYDEDNRSRRMSSVTPDGYGRDDGETDIITDEPEVTINSTYMAGVVDERIMEKNRIQYIIVKDGDTREKLEDDLQLLRWELPRYNELDRDFSLTAGQVLYLQPKRTKAAPGIRYHDVADGDTMYSISQEYGIKLKSLYEMNRMEEGTQPSPGEKIWLRDTKP